MAVAKRFLIAGGTISALIAILHFILTLKPEYYQFVNPEQASTLAQMALQGSSATTIATAALALIFAIWAVYAFSGAGMIGCLPLLRAILIVIGVIYLLRALFLPTEIRMTVNQGYPIRFAVYSFISLVAGLFYLLGIFLQRAFLSSSKKS